MNPQAFSPKLNLNNIFGSLSDPTRRDILQRMAAGEMTVSEVATHYPLTLAAVSKHLQILEQAKLIIKRRAGKQQYVSLAPYAFKDATEYLEWYRDVWDQRLDALEGLLKQDDI